MTADVPMIECDLSHPVSGEQALDWAKTADWFFGSYYKFSFTFEATVYVAFPDDLEAHEAHASVTIGGDSSEIYKLRVEPHEPLEWDTFAWRGSMLLIIRDSDGSELARVSRDRD